jgi:hypothetical protein
MSAKSIEIMAASGENILQWRRKIGENGEGEETEASISAAKTA